ncbi:hypothetical protein ACQKMK_02150 [Viridibacillus arvi]|uniref:hypothetical protein n=1 Tax=Viridibacillus arvi TaxID=263475 RepID=UPI003D016089
MLKVNKQTLIKLAMILGILLIGFSLGNGMKSAFADQDLQTMLTNWFNIKKTNSVSEIDQAITAEKEQLIGNIKGEIQLEMKRTADELATFKNAEKEQRIAALRDYTSELIANKKSSIREDKEADMESYEAEINWIVEEAIAKINGTPISEKPKQAPDSTKPNPDTSKDTEPSTKPDSSTDPAPEQSPDSNSTSSPNTPSPKDENDELNEKDNNNTSEIEKNDKVSDPAV